MWSKDERQIIDGNHQSVDYITFDFLSKFLKILKFAGLLFLLNLIEK